MPLKFPNARLLIHDLLLSGLSGKEAIARGACEYGLISPDCFTEVQVSDNETCQCLSTAKNVLRKHFELSPGAPSAHLVNLETVLSAFELDLLAYRKAIITPVECCEQSQISHDSRFAPAAFDIMLQQIRRFS